MEKSAHPLPLRMRSLGYRPGLAKTDENSPRGWIVQHSQEATLRWRKQQGAESVHLLCSPVGGVENAQPGMPEQPYSHPGSREDGASSGCKVSGQTIFYCEYAAGGQRRSGNF